MTALASVACSSPPPPAAPVSHAAAASHSSPVTLEQLAATFLACINRAFENEQPVTDDFEMTFQRMEGHWLVVGLDLDIEIDLEKSTCDGDSIERPARSRHATRFDDIAEAGVACARGEPWHGKGPAGDPLDLTQPVVTRLRDGKLIVTFHEPDHPDSSPAGAIAIAVATCSAYTAAPAAADD